tara:strand:- start:234 stop:1103 length:870 start_codon:yes stop_codon:yes gene_type:complete
MEVKMTQLIEPKKFSRTVDRLRSFFLSKGFEEVHTQNRLSILAACEDPFNVATYNYAGEIWPLPQTGQMWLEYELLTKPSSKGFFCVSTSYRQEPNAVAGRHDIIFPMFEFEMPGNIHDLQQMNIELCEYLGFPKLDIDMYHNWTNMFDVPELGNDEEEKIQNGMITHFPEFTHPFWNMSRNTDGTAKKIDVILGGMETIGSAERSTDVHQMRQTFYDITDGKYAQLLFDLFSRERVEAELEEFLKHDFFERVGGGIGITRLLSAFDKTSSSYTDRWIKAFTSDTSTPK